MEKLSVAQARQVEAVGKHVKLQGWVRTRRDSKGGFSFIQLNDGSCQVNREVRADQKRQNYESAIKKLGAGASICVSGGVRAAPAKGQATQVHAHSIHVYGLADPESFPLQKKGHSPGFLR